MPAQEMAEKKVALRMRTQELLMFAKNIELNQENFDEESEDLGWFKKSKKNRSLKKKMSELKKNFYILENELEVYDIENTLTANPLTACLKLFIGKFITVRPHSITDFAVDMAAYYSIQFGNKGR